MLDFFTDSAAFSTFLDSGKIIIADIVLSGDNALIIGMAAAGLAPELRKKAILFGMIVAAVLRILFALIATYLLGIPGLLLVGSFLLFYVCWGLYQEIKSQRDENSADELEMMDGQDGSSDGKPRRTLGQALIAITIADVSMSLDNVIAVAAIADGDSNKLIIGLGLAIILMAFAATIIMKLLTRYPWISWAGLIVLLYVSAEMFYRGIFDETNGILAYLRGAGIIG